MNKRLISLLAGMCLVIPLCVGLAGAQTSRTLAYTDNPAIAKGFKNQGAYSASVSYNLNDVVLSAGVNYYSLQNGNLGNTPVASPTQWQAFGAASSQSQGPAGFFTGTGAVTVTGTEAAGAVCIGVSPTTCNLQPLSADLLVPASSVSCSGGTTVEVGATITSPGFTCSYSSTPVSATITNTDGISSPLALAPPFTAAIVLGSFVHASAATTAFTVSAAFSSGVTKTAAQSLQWLPRVFGGVGTAGVTGATASGTTAVLQGATGTLTSAGLSNSQVGQTFGPYTLAAQYVHLLLIGSGHTSFTDAASGIPVPFDAPVAITFVNTNGAAIQMYDYKATSYSTTNPGTTLSIKVNN